MTDDLIAKMVATNKDVLLTVVNAQEWILDVTKHVNVCHGILFVIMIVSALMVQMKSVAH